MSVLLAGRRVGVRDTSTPGSVPDGGVPHMMYYLNCATHVTTLAIQAHLTDYQNWRNLTDTDFLLLGGLAKRLTPSVLTRAGVFILDSDHSLCRPGFSGAFLEITDRRVTALASRDVYLRVNGSESQKFSPSLVSGFNPTTSRHFPE
jgi:hypothetical protein